MLRGCQPHPLQYGILGNVFLWNAIYLFLFQLLFTKSTDYIFFFCFCLKLHLIQDPEGKRNEDK